MNKALIDFIKQSSTGLTSIADKRQCERIVTILLDEEHMAVEPVLERICHSQFAAELLDFVMEKYRGTTAWSEFLKKVIAIPHAKWVKYDVDGFHWKAENEYIKWHIRYFIVKKDFRRAWDEINKALSRLGFGIGIHCRNDREVADFLKSLVRELFEAMVTAAKLQSLALADYTDVNTSPSHTVYETKPNHHHKPRSYSASFKRPSLAFAALWGETKSPGDWRVRTFTPEGGMVLKIAEHFHNRKSEARRQKHLEAVAGYERSHRQK